MSPHVPDAGRGTCRNCGALLTGAFCATCGQSADVHVPSTHELIHEALEGITHSDSRLWRSLLDLWFKPGRLTKQFIAGRRVAYLPPFRLYLVLSVLFFLVASFSGKPGGSVIRFDVDEQKQETPEQTCKDLTVRLLGPRWESRLRHACEQSVRDSGESLTHVALSNMPKAMFLFLPVIAFLHMLLYWRPRHRYAEHLLFFLHLHAFFFSLMTVLVLAGRTADALPWLGTPVGVSSKLLLWAVPVYTVVAMKQVFQRSWTRTVLKAAALSVVYVALLGVTIGAVFVYAVLQL